MSNRCPIPIQNIAESDSCGNNQSGVRAIYFCPVADVVTINAARPTTITSYEDKVTIGDNLSSSQEAISCATGKGFAKMYCADDLGELVYTPQGQQGSRSFKAELEIFHPAFKSDILGFMATHNNQELLIVCELNNDRFHLIGNARRGAKFADSTKATSGKAVTDANGAECHFEWNTDAPQIFYDGWTPEDANKGLPLIEDSDADDSND